MENFFEVIPLIEQYKDELVIVSLGRLTSLAVLFILCKNLMQQIAIDFDYNLFFKHFMSLMTDEQF